ncbi:uncharacterized protein BO88DRAFT_146787 [Aspergillus vadensis CBS 113365]|uniref:Uncharacterized protein n=1 Tax=Aspergillus vadensis (strain CBS 113365 / IMI 142717 / IBT 24658) TaxID=1448311 RepID=A0A319AXZ7_ASPVC|nr:hypothetical protein BO88DRAFT_146787 [Aspergillus vadensis CBS 113365]PYH65266.1 hypothetical protein BO88DRAFT_146787 [Aspergillus vadensis CBS 113365]
MLFHLWLSHPSSQVHACVLYVSACSTASDLPFPRLCQPLPLLILILYSSILFWYLGPASLDPSCLSNASVGSRGRDSVAGNRLWFIISASTFPLPWSVTSVHRPSRLVITVSHKNFVSNDAHLSRPVSLLRKGCWRLLHP